MQVAKYLSQELRKEPFFKDYNSASFESMSRDEILQIFNDVLAHLDPKQHMQIIHEDPADTIYRMMEFLRVLKHKPSLEDPSKFRDGIQNGRPEVICPIMAWMLEKKETLKTRAYLAHFLVEVDIPYDLLAEDDIVETRQKYLNLIEEFKNVHKQSEKFKVGHNTVGLMNDMQNIEHDLECIRRRIDVSRSKFVDYPDQAAVLRQARWNRKAREKAQELLKQAHMEEVKYRECEERIRHNRRILKDIRDKSGGRTGEGIVEALEENVEVLKYIVLEKIPMEMEMNERTITAMKLVENDPPHSQHELAELKMKSQMIKNEVHTLESRIVRKIHDGDLQQLREQSDQAEKVRHLKAVKLEALHRESVVQRKLYDHLNMERTCNLKVDSGLVLSDEQYRNYMKSMRLKAGRYKQARTELARIQSELGILSTTKFILDGELKETAENLAGIESRLGIPGFSEAQSRLETLSEEKSALDETNRTNLFEMSCISKDLHDTLALKKLHLEPLLKDLQGKRLEFQLLEADYKKLKGQYESSLTAIELDSVHYQQKLTGLSKEQKKLKLEHSKLLAEMSVMRTNLRRAEEESKLEAHSIIGKEKSRGLKDKLLTKILEEERRGKAVKEETEGIEELCSKRKQQGEYWTNLIRILKAKMDVRREQQQYSQT